MKHKYNPTAERDSYTGRYIFTIQKQDQSVDTIFLPSNITTDTDVRKWWAREWKGMGKTNKAERIKWEK